MDMLKLAGGLIVFALCIWLYVRERGTGRRLRAQWEEAVAAVNERNFEKACERLKRVVKRAPMWADSRRLLGNVLFHLGRHEEAEKELRMATAFEPRNALAHFDLGVFLSLMEPPRTEEAFESLSKSLELDPGMRKHLAELEPRLGLHGHPRMKELLGE